MNEQTRNNIIHRWQLGQSQREIAKRLRVSRNTIKAILDELQQAREGQTISVDAPPPRKKRASVLDQFEPQIKVLLVRYPKMQVAEILRHLRASGYHASYTILRQRVNQIRRSTTCGELAGLASPGAVAKVLYREVDIDLAPHGRQRTNLFVYQLEYSQRKYLHLTSTTDLTTTIHEHVRAFEHLGGAAVSAHYENVPGVIERSGDAEAVFNPTFLRFASHYGFRPVSCRSPIRVGASDDEAFLMQLLVKVLHGNRFRSMDHANDELLTWVTSVADVLPYRGSRPIDLHCEEIPHLIPLPTNPWRG